MIETLLAVGALASGLFLLYSGAEGLVRGAIRLAFQMGMTPLLIGLTVVAFGTSAPEMGVSVSAAVKGHPDIALGNVVGSNIANIAMILGVGALLRPLPVHLRLVRLEVPFLVLLGLGFWVMGYAETVSRPAGFLLLLLFPVYCVVLYLKGRREPLEAHLQFQEALAPKNSLLMDLLIIILGCVALVAGAKLLVWGASNLARELGVPELFIGLTVTALGTSLPELATTIAAVRKGHGDIVVGNVIGSNIANSTAVLGAAAALSPLTVSPMAFHRDIPVMLGLTVALFPMMNSGLEIKRWAGLALLVSYLLYVCLISSWMWGSP